MRKGGKIHLTPVRTSTSIAIYLLDMFEWIRAIVRKLFEIELFGNKKY